MAWPKGRRRSDEVRAAIALGQRAYHATVDRSVRVCERCGKECVGAKGLAVHTSKRHGVNETSGAKA